MECVIEQLRRRASAGVDLAWPVVAAAATTSHPSAVAELLDRRLDGVTVEGVFTADEAALAVERFRQVGWMDWTFGAVLGLSVGMVGPEDGDRSAYYDESDRCRAIYRDAFGFDPHDRVADVLGSMSRELEPAVPRDGDRAYNPGQVRVFVPGRGGLPAHHGNEFHQGRDDTAVDHLARTTAVRDHLSYFVVLQEPETGGALSVYDLTSDDEDGSSIGPFGRADRDDSGFEGIPSRRFAPRVGDLLVFGGGWRWHRVDPVAGARERITYGGFCAPSLDGRSLYFWA